MTKEHVIPNADKIKFRVPGDRVDHKMVAVIAMIVALSHLLTIRDTHLTDGAPELSVVLLTTAMYYIAWCLIIGVETWAINRARALKVDVLGSKVSITGKGGELTIEAARMYISEPYPNLTHFLIIESLAGEQRTVPLDKRYSAESIKSFNDSHVFVE